MRKWVDLYLSELADKDPSVRLLIADVGDFPVFRCHHSDKFINAGVSESNCIGVAAGLSAGGYRVFVYGVSSFFLYRAFEQLKYSIAYWRKPVTFIGVGFGWKYYNIGIGHFCPDDIALCRLLPGLRIKTPYTLDQLKEDIRCSSVDCPSYLRITASIMEDAPESGDSGEYLIVSYGEMARIATKVWFKLDRSKFDISLLRDLDESSMTSLRKKAVNKKLITIEDQCGIGSVGNILAEAGNVPVLQFQLPVIPTGVAESREALLRYYGLDVETILINIKKFESEYE